MAIIEQLNLLKSDVLKWNLWRESNPETLIDLSEADFSQAVLSDANLSRANLSGADLRYTNLQRANLSKSNLEKVDLFKSDLQGAYLVEANLMSADFTEAKLNFANLSQANLKNASLINSHLEHTQLDGANLAYAQLSTQYFNNHTSLLNTNLTLANLRGSKNYILNETFVEKTIFNPFSQEPWLVLQRTYTGIMFSIIILGTVLFFGTYAGEALFWTSINNSQLVFLKFQSNVIESIDRVPNITDESINKLLINDIENSQFIQNDKKIQIWNGINNLFSKVLHEKKLQLIRKISLIEPCLQSKCKKTNVLSILLGYKGDFFNSTSNFFLSILLIGYNIVRGVMTIYISRLSEEQKVSCCSPKREQYVNYIDVFGKSIRVSLFDVHQKIMNPLALLSTVILIVRLIMLLTKNVYIPAILILF